MRKTPMSNDRGETIVEVVAAFLLLLLFIGMFNMAISFSRSMMNRANLLRETMYQSETGLRRPGEADPAVTADTLDGETDQTLTFQGDRSSFSLTVQRGTSKAGDYTYHQYAPKEAP